ncbi:TetR/AcrR family transcriptional regulator [Halomarina ordinaria]|uniref:TetR/AcrR family transcriptional regulator n=1 Tax=Halomarina ordinaria TaxID=3033939 RepID=A0ABD5UCX3_9EURY|nr:TetR/AcrR family transcriptional regulator [Halomarina sp. PSRA2]
MAVDPDADERGSTETEIMEATYRALCKHGYSGLSISRIADEFEKSKSSLYYHYDSKDDLLVAFLTFAVDRFEASVATERSDDPMADLEGVIERLLPLRPTDEQRQIQALLVDLRSQAVTDERFRERFADIDERLVTTLTEVIERGIERGTFNEVDATRVAEHVLAVLNGAMVARATTDREAAVAAARVSLSSYLDTVLRR